jgi:hypothetical protein
MLRLEDGEVVDEQIMFSEIEERIRDVRTGPRRPTVLCSPTAPKAR